MIRNEVIIGVRDVTKSSEWYQTLLNCQSSHGGETFETLTDESDNVILSLHKWGDHDHPTLANPDIQPGNGLILYFRIGDIEQVWQNAQKLNANIENTPHLNVNSGKKEFALRDIDGYYILVSL